MLYLYADGQTNISWNLSKYCPYTTSNPVQTVSSTRQTLKAIFVQTQSFSKCELDPKDGHMARVEK